MSRLARMMDKLKAEGTAEVSARQGADIEKFRLFYQTEYYKEFREGIEKQLNVLDRLAQTDPGTLVLLQGQRNALIGILDDLDKKERLVNTYLRYQSI